MNSDKPEGDTKIPLDNYAALVRTACEIADEVQQRRIELIAELRGAVANDDREKALRLLDDLEANS